MVSVADAELKPGQIRFGIKSAYPFSRFWANYEPDDVIPVWYPWYYVTLGVKMDTYLKKGMSYRDLVAVDSLRPVRERLASKPELSETELMDGVTPESKISADEAESEAVDLMKGIVLSRNKLLKDYDIETLSVELVRHKTFIVQLKGRQPAEWLYLDSHFDAATRLGMRPEILKHVVSSYEHT